MFVKRSQLSTLALPTNGRLYFDGAGGSRYIFFDGSNMYCKGANWIVSDGAVICGGGLQVGAGQSLYGWSTDPVHIKGMMVDGGTAVACKVNTNVVWANAAAKLLSIQNNSVEKAYVDINGSFVVNSMTCTSLSINSNGTAHVNAGDSSASPGNATLNVPSGRSAAAAAASTVVITNSTITTNSKVFISPLDADTAVVKYKVAVASGSFTVTGYNAAGVATNFAATWKFDWFAINS